MSQTDDFKEVATSAKTEVASFDGHKKGFVGKFHHALHTTPALVPLIVLFAAIVVFGALLGSKFFSPFALGSVDILDCDRSRTLNSSFANGGLNGQRSFCDFG